MYAPINGSLTPLPFEETMSFLPGQYDFVVSATVGTDMYYSRLHLNVSTEHDQDLLLSPGHKVSGSITVLDDQGKGTEVPGLVCKLSSDSPFAQSFNASSPSKGCLGSSYSSGHYYLGLAGMPQDAYVVAAKIDDKDVLAEGISLTADTDLQVVVKTSGSSLEGIVSNAAQKNIANAVVALVPDVPLRAAGVLYRSAVSDINGNYQLRGIAPGNYHLFAWSNLEGAAYRNVEFMKEFNDLGTPVQIDGPHEAINITILN
jgi:hypothetical protein